MLAMQQLRHDAWNIRSTGGRPSYYGEYVEAQWIAERQRKEAEESEARRRQEEIEAEAQRIAEAERQEEEKKLRIARRELMKARRMLSQAEIEHLEAQAEADKLRHEIETRQEAIGEARRQRELEAAIEQLQAEINAQYRKEVERKRREAEKELAEIMMLFMMEV